MIFCGKLQMVAVRFCNSGVTCWSLFFSGCLRAWDVVNPGWSLWALGQRCPDAGPVLAGWPLNAAMVRKNLANVGTMLVQRLRRWANILPTFLLSPTWSSLCRWASARGHQHSSIIIILWLPTTPRAWVDCETGNLDRGEREWIGPQSGKNPIPSTFHSTRWPIMLLS